jgi:hypothetical protein
MKILSAVTTCSLNLSFFWTAESSFSHARTYMKESSDAEINLLVFDFSEKPQDIGLPSWATRLMLAGYGFADNFNVMRNIAITHSYDYLFYFNDDVILHKEFLDKAIFYLENNPDVGFLGGVSQQGGWNEQSNPQAIPEPVFDFEDLNDLSRLNWEFSACVIRTEALKDTGPMDRMFSLKVGLCCDNDYLYRMRKMGWRTIRSSWTTFFHMKAMTQSKLRDPFNPNDPHRLRAVTWMSWKWGVDIRMGWISVAAFSEPFNGEEIEIIDDNTVRIGSKIHNLPEC